jgi:hypothetical protein
LGIEVRRPRRGNNRRTPSKITGCPLTKPFARPLLERAQKKKPRGGRGASGTCCTGKLSTEVRASSASPRRRFSWISRRPTGLGTPRCSRCGGIVWKTRSVPPFCAICLRRRGQINQRARVGRIQRAKKAEMAYITGAYHHARPPQRLDRRAVPIQYRLWAHPGGVGGVRADIRLGLVLRALRGAIRAIKEAGHRFVTLAEMADGFLRSESEPAAKLASSAPEALFPRTAFSAKV